MYNDIVDSHELWAAAQLAPGEGIEDGVDRIDSLIADSVRDAARWRKFVSILQSVYDGDTFESEMLDVYCSMQSGYKNQRTVQAELRWNDVRDEPLDFGSAVDAA